MGFGAEMKDFVAAFSTGYKISSDSAEQRRKQKERDEDRPLDVELKKANVKKAVASAAYMDHLGKEKGGEFDIEGEIKKHLNTGGDTSAPSKLSALNPEVKAAIDQEFPEAGLRQYAYGLARGEVGAGGPETNSKTSRARGFAQFMPETAKEYGLADPNDPVAAAKALRAFTTDNYNTLKQTLKRPPTYGELSAAHQQGATGAANLILGRASLKPEFAKANNINPTASPAEQLRALQQYYYNNGVPQGVAAFAAGGLVEDDEEATPATPAAAVDAETPVTGGGGEPTTIPEILSRAVGFLKGEYGLDKVGGVATPETAADRVRSLRKLSSADGAAAVEDVAKAAKMLDPKGELDIAQIHLRVLKSGYDFYLKRGQPQKADAYAASFLKYARTQSAEYADRALRALQAGDADTAARMAERAYGVIPNGRDVSIAVEDGKPVYTLKTPNGEVLERGTFSPEQFAAAAMGLRDGSAFWESIGSGAAGPKNARTVAPSKAYTTALQSLDQPTSTPTFEDQVPIGYGGGDDARTNKLPKNEQERSPVGMFDVPVNLDAGFATSPEAAQARPNDLYVLPPDTRQAIPTLTGSQLAAMTPQERADITKRYKERDKALAGPAPRGRQKDLKATSPKDMETLLKDVDTEIEAYKTRAQATGQTKRTTEEEKRNTTLTTEVMRPAVIHVIQENQGITPSEAVDAAARIMHADPKDPDKSLYTARIGRDGLYNVSFDNGRSIRMSAETALPLITAQKQEAAQYRRINEIAAQKQARKDAIIETMKSSGGRAIETAIDFLKKVPQREIEKYEKARKRAIELPAGP